MEIVVAVVALVVGIGIGRWTKKGRSRDDEAQSLQDARMALKADPANTSRVIRAVHCRSTGATERRDGRGARL
jgi:hypothetical protein